MNNHGEHAWEAWLKFWWTVLIAGVLLTGCAQTVWDKPGVTEADWRRDLYECHYAVAALPPIAQERWDVLNSAAWWSIARQQQMETLCFEAKGYRRVQ